MSGITQYSTLVEDLGTVADINNGTVDIPQFNPAMGTLDAILVNITAAAQGSVGIQNLELTPATLVAVPFDTVTLRDSEADLLSVVTPNAVYEQAVAAASGTTTFGAPSGVTDTFGTIAGTGYAIDVAAYIGTGTLTATLTGTPHLAVGGGDNLAAVGSLAVGGGNVSVDYVYSIGTAAAVPPLPPPLPTPIPVPPVVLPPPMLPPATVTTPVQQLVLPNQPTGWTQTGTVQQFDPALGTLIAVDVTIVTDVVGTDRAGNVASVAAAFTAEALGEIKLADAAGMIPAVGVADAVGVTTLGAYDGTIDYAGTSGTTVPVAITATSTNVITGPFTDPNIFGTGSFTITATGTSYGGVIGGPQDSLMLAGEVGGTIDVSYTYIPCFLAGTRIATPDGDVPIETLRPGDTVCTAGGDTACVRTVHHRRVHCRGHAALRPVRIRADAWDSGVPARDLLLSPDHAIYTDGVLIPVRHLLNDTTVTRVERDVASYFHLQLDRHDVVLAEGMPCESYLEIDTDAFAGRPRGTLGSAAPRLWEAAGCAPLAVTGPAVARARARLGRSRADIRPAQADGAGARP